MQDGKPAPFSNGPAGPNKEPTIDTSGPGAGGGAGAGGGGHGDDLTAEEAAGFAKLNWTDSQRYEKAPYMNN